MNKELIDRAWRVLPAEFKEEVKELYKHENKMLAPIDGVTTLNEIFGHDNLTSDAEGEEMLTCEKSEVQGFYQEALELIDRGKRNNYLNDKLVGIGQKNILYTLFGSKCLPDEEPKPVEPKFPKGSMVHSTFFGYEGDYRVVEYDDSTPRYYDCINREGRHFRFPESDLEPYTEPNNLEHLNERLVKAIIDKDNKTIGEEIRNMPPVEDPEKIINANNGYLAKTCTDDCPSQRPSQDFDRIIKDGFAKERRLNIAAMAMQGLLSNCNFVPNTSISDSELINDIVGKSFELADELIRQAEKGGES